MNGYKTKYPRKKGKASLFRDCIYLPVKNKTAKAKSAHTNRNITNESNENHKKTADKYHAPGRWWSKNSRYGTLPALIALPPRIFTNSSGYETY